MRTMIAAALFMATSVSAAPINEPDFSEPLGPKVCWVAHGSLRCISW